MTEFPTLFLSHGAPDLPLTDHPAKYAWQKIGANLPRPQAIIIVSAHWLTKELTISGAHSYTTMHDFSGFCPELYQITYPALGSRELANELKEQFASADINSEIDIRRGLDHGAWIPLSMLFPEADIPVVQLSLPMDADIDTLLSIGNVLVQQRHQNLIVCSGAITHNLKRLAPEGTPPEGWAEAFSSWVKEQLLSGNTTCLRQFRSAPYMRLAHPTEEHFLPLFVALGTARGEPVKLLHESFSCGNMSMAVFAFGQSEQVPIN